ncbi:MAG: carboxyltransferase domain-containing protein, partial [Zestosphaera sp.]
LGEVDPEIAAPRLETPRVKIPAGSVGIAGKMTGVYGLESPGGWRLIGRTPLTMFNYRRSPPIPIAPGDVVVFKPITLEEFNKLRGLYVGDYSG